MNNNHFPTMRSSSGVVALGKTKSLISTTNKILAAPSKLLADILQYKPFAQCGHSASIVSIVEFSNGKHIISGGVKGTLRLWDALTEKMIRTFEGHEDKITSIALTSDEKYLLSADYCGKIKLWEIKTGKELESFDGNEGYIDIFVAITPDNKYFMSNSYGKIKLTDIKTGECIKKFSNDYYRPTRTSQGIYAFLHDSQHLNIINLTDESLVGTLNHNLFGVKIMPSGKHILCESGKTYKLLEISTGREIIEYSRAYSRYENENRIAITSDGNFVVLGHENGTIDLIDASTQKIIRTFRHNSSFITYIGISDDEKFIISADQSGSLKLFEISTGKEAKNFGNDDSAGYFSLSPDEKFALSSTSSDGMEEDLVIWDICDAKIINSTKFYTCDGLESFSITSDEKHTISWNGAYDTLWEYTVKNQKPKALRWYPEEEGSSIASNPNGKLSLSSKENKLILKDIAKNKELLYFIKYIDGEWVCITPDGYFNHSKNARQYLSITTTGMNAIDIDDATYNKYYRPNGLLDIVQEITK
jgi:WD40 repeat protein